jgi:hypothetical protein
MAARVKVIALADLGEQIVASAAVARGDLFLRTRQHLYRIGGGK